MLIILIAVWPLVGRSATYGDYTYVVDAVSGGVTITGYNCAGGNVIMPDSIEGLPVTRIESRAFEGCTDLTRIVLPDGVTSIGENAFADCSSLTSITIHGSVTSIGMFAFRGCIGLTNVTIPNSVTSIGGGAFLGCSGLTRIAISDSVAFLDNMVFGECTGLTNITIPESVTRIGGSLLPSFLGCTNLTSVYFLGDTQEVRTGEFRDTQATIYRLAGTTGWGTTFNDRPTALWIPVVPNLPSVSTDNPLRLVTHSPAPASVRVQRSDNLLDWEDWRTVTRDAGPSELQDADTTARPYRFYRAVEE